MPARPTGTLIEFPLERARPSSRPDASGASAAVLIFTGVRIERMQEIAERLPVARSAKRGEAEFR